MARVSSTGFSVTPARGLPPAPPRNSTVHSEGSQFSPMRSTMRRTSGGMGCSTGFRASSSTYHCACSPPEEQHGAAGGPAFPPAGVDDAAPLGRQGLLEGLQGLVEHVPLRVLAGGG